MAFWSKHRPRVPHRPKRKELERILTGSWQDFEAWIRDAIGGGFVWKVRPRDTRANRETVVESICGAIERHGGSFPERDAFLERDNPTSPAP